jgi:short-subunit dehydrogenase
MQFNESNFLIVSADVSIEKNCEYLIHQTIQKYNRIDILINNAGISMRAAFLDLDVAVIKQLMDINFWGTVYCCKYALPYLIQAKGSIAGISSVAGFKGLPARTGYSASKFAMNGFLESLRLEMINKHVSVNIICPGYTNSNIRNAALNKAGNQQGETPLDEKKLMSAEQVAHEILLAIQNRKNFTVLTLLGKVTFWLNKFFPKFIDQQTLKLISKESGSPI